MYIRTLLRLPEPLGRLFRIYTARIELLTPGCLSCLAATMTARRSVRFIVTRVAFLPRRMSIFRVAMRNMTDAILSRWEHVFGLVHIRCCVLHKTMSVWTIVPWR